MINLKARDNTRTPMQWSSSANAGFCSADVKPWMRVNDDYPAVNVAAQLNDPHSVFSHWKRCLELRKQHKDVFVYGDFEVLDPEDKDVVAFVRWSGEESWVTVTNFTGKGLEYEGLGEVEVEEWVLGNYELQEHNDSSSYVLKLRPWEGLIGRCKHKVTCP